MAAIKIGIIGGTGLSDMDILTDKTETYPETPYGQPGPLVEGNISGVPCVLMNRHGRGYSIMPTNIPYRANIWALKEAGCTHVIAVTACGSLAEEYKPGHFVTPDQFIDFTKKRSYTFYDGAAGSPEGICFLPMHSPFCSDTRELIQKTSEELEIECHSTGTIVTVEGPRFSTVAESHMYRSWNGHIINMTTSPEVTLANEAGMSYTTIAMVTDYDCWRENEEAVSVEAVMNQMKTNAQNLVRLLLAAIPKFLEKDWECVVKAKRDRVAQNTILPKKPE